jgi:diadenosine tetraphosphatase ApaH/serine/threonine PP2A family protein phosphatase
MEQVEVTKELLESFIEKLLRNDHCSFDAGVVVTVCKMIKDVLRNEDNILYLDIPIYVVGDIHAKLSDMIAVIKQGGDFMGVRYLFLGDYVDRGGEDIRVLMLLFAMKLLAPNNVHLLRGNHEVKNINKVYGFQNACESLYGKNMGVNVWDEVNDVFNYLPLAAIIDKNYIFCVHGGLSPAYETIESIGNIDRFNLSLNFDILWSDPYDLEISQEGYAVSSRGAGYLWDQNASARFLINNNFRGTFHD